MYTSQQHKMNLLAVFTHWESGICMKNQTRYKEKNIQRKIRQDTKLWGFPKNKNTWGSRWPSGWERVLLDSRAPVGWRFDSALEVGWPFFELFFNFSSVSIHRKTCWKSICFLLNSRLLVPSIFLFYFWRLFLKCFQYLEVNMINHRVEF